MIVFFTFLTFYSAYFDKVKDCGCFGDALKLTPWESFTKDLMLLFFILILFGSKAHINPFSESWHNRFSSAKFYCKFMVWLPCVNAFTSNRF